MHAGAICLRRVLKGSHIQFYERVGPHVPECQAARNVAPPSLSIGGLAEPKPSVRCLEGEGRPQGM